MKNYKNFTIDRYQKVNESSFWKTFGNVYQKIVSFFGERSWYYLNKFLEKIRALPEDKRKIILWAAVIVIGLVFFAWYFKNMKLVLPDKEKLQRDLKLDDLKEDLKNVPKFEMPKP